MKGITLNFTKRVNGPKDDYNNPTFTTREFSIDDCLVGANAAPYNANETQAVDRARSQVIVHLPKTSDEQIDDCEFVYENRKWRVIDQTPAFIKENTPTRWNRYAIAEEYR